MFRWQFPTNTRVLRRRDVVSSSQPSHFVIIRCPVESTPPAARAQFNQLVIGGNPESGAMSRLVVQSVVKALGLASTDATASQPRQLADIECDEGTDAIVDVLIPLFVLCLMCVLQCEGYPVRGAKISHTLYL